MNHYHYYREKDYTALQSELDTLCREEESTNLAIKISNIIGNFKKTSVSKDKKELRKMLSDRGILCLKIAETLVNNKRELYKKYPNMLGLLEDETKTNEEKDIVLGEYKRDIEVITKEDVEGLAVIQEHYAYLKEVLNDLGLSIKELDYACMEEQ